MVWVGRDITAHLLPPLPQAGALYTRLGRSKPLDGGEKKRLNLWVEINTERKEQKGNERKTREYPKQVKAEKSLA